MNALKKKRRKIRRDANEPKNRVRNESQKKKKTIQNKTEWMRASEDETQK